MVDGFKYQSIITVYLQYPATVQLSASMLLLNEAVEPKHFGQWVFDRGQGLLAVVISAANTLQSYEAPVLAQQIAEQLAHNLAMAELNQPLHFQVIHEKRATFSCSPGLVRASMLLGLPNAYLAGDYVSTEPLAPLYPATLETAVISGINAALALI